MTQPDFATRFPKMTPIKSPPTMYLLNGIGTRVHGARDPDTETGTYVTTLCICILFVPIIALRAYRVARAQQGWYFLGREPLSTFARAWNSLLLFSIVAGISIIGLNSYVSSPTYKAHRQLVQANTLADKGQFAQAARIYQTLVSSGSESATAAQALKNLIDGQPHALPLDQAAPVFTAASRISTRAPGAYSPADLATKGLQLVTQRGDSDPKAAIALLTALRPMALDTREIDAARLPLLRKWTAAEPTNIDAAISLASLLEQQNQLDEAKKLLLPFKDKLANTEGARVLGILYAHEGNLDDAYALLWPYVTPRLDRLHTAEKIADQVIHSAWDHEIQLLKDNKAPQEFYQRYESATQERKGAMVDEYVNARIKNDPQLQAAQESLAEESQIVPVTLELGIVMLERAQAQPAPETRKKQLEATQDVFLAIKSAAGDSDEYRIFLGQVYYWLGKQADGRKLFDEFLASKSRSALSLATIANSLRQLGVNGDARTLAEEGYAKATVPQERFDLARLRSLMYKDTDDEITWLEKSNVEDPVTRANLATARGNKLIEQHRDSDAVTQFHIAIDAYNTLPRNPGTLNDTGLAYYSLFNVTGDHQDMDRCLDYIQQAINLNPSDSIFLFNSAALVLEASLADIIGHDLDLKALHANGDISMIRYLYHDQAGHDAFAKRISEHPGIARALAYLDKATIVSPKNARAYEMAYSIHSFTQNEAAMRTLEQRIRSADIDTADSLNDYKDYISGTTDAKHTTNAASALNRIEETATAQRARGGATAAAALVQNSQLLLSLDAYTHDSDPDKILKLAQDAYVLFPSSAAHSAMTQAYFFRAARTLARTVPAYAQLDKKCQRSVGTMLLLTYAATDPADLGNSVRQNPDFQKGAAQLTEDLQNFPSFCAGYDWAVLKAINSPQAARAAEIIRTNPRVLQENSITQLLGPANAGQALETYFIFQCLNKPDEARAAFKVAIAQRIPVPIQP